MTDKKFTDEEIIKGLERCVKRGNRNYDTDIVLDLINRQKAEIEELKNYVNRCKSGEEYWVKCLLEKPNEAIKEFAERLKKNLFYRCGDINYSETCDLRKLIDNLLKEMVGEEE